MFDIKAAKSQIGNHQGNGWFTLIDILYDNIPENIIITDVFQKFSGLEIRYEGKDIEFEHLISQLRFISQKMCEVCGQSGGYTIIDGWERTLCNLHYHEIDAKKKYKD